MKLALIALLSLGLACNAAHAADTAPKALDSTFGFTVALDTGWVLLSPDKVAGSAEALTAATLGLPQINQLELNKIIDRVKAGHVEFYLDASLSSPQFTNNISVQLKPRTQDYAQASQDEVDALCASLAKDLEEVWSTPVELRGCKIVSSNGKAGLAYSYVIRANDMFVMQYELPFDASQTALVVGGGRLDNDVMTRVVTALHAIANAVMAHAR